MQGGLVGHNQTKGIVNDVPKALVPVQNISPTQMDGGRRKSLFCSCNSKWSIGHVCNVPELFLIEEIVEQKKVPKIVVVDKEGEDPGQFFLDEELEICLNAVTGTPNPKTLSHKGLKELTGSNPYRFR